MRIRRVRWAITGTAMRGLARREKAPPKCSSASQAGAKPRESPGLMASNISAWRAAGAGPAASAAWKRSPNRMADRSIQHRLPARSLETEETFEVPPENLLFLLCGEAGQSLHPGDGRGMPR